VYSNPSNVSLSQERTRVRWAQNHLAAATYVSPLPARERARVRWAQNHLAAATYVSPLPARERARVRVSPLIPGEGQVR
jgi:hypothetical protein